jgi:hypothetical protein
MNIPKKIRRTLNLIFIAGLSAGPAMMCTAQQNAQTAQQAPAGSPAVPQKDSNLPATSQNAPTSTQANPQNDQAGQPQPAKPQSRGTTIDPSQAPLQPVTTYPEAPTPQQDQQQNSAQSTQNTQSGPAQQPKKSVTEPVGAAAAEKVPTAGGAASKPAGIAIAPAKQHQTRSLLIKIGAIAAAGVAVGTVYGLSHGTSSTPPNSAMPGAIHK